MNTNEMIEFYLDHDVLVSPEMAKDLESNPLPLTTQFIVLNKDTINIVQNKMQIHTEDFEKAIVLKEKRKDTKLYDKFTEYLSSATFVAQTPGIQSHPGNQDKQVLSESNATATPTTAATILPQSKNIETKIQDVPKAKNLQAEVIEMKKNMKNFSSTLNLSSGIGIDIKREDVRKEFQSNKSILKSQEKKAAAEIFASSHDNSSQYIDSSASDAAQDTPDIHTAPANTSSFVFTEQKEKFMKDNKIRIVSSYTSKSKKWLVSDFVSLYTSRFRELEKILRSRQELQNLTAIRRISEKKERENVALVGVVYEKSVTKSGNLMFTIEDPTGSIKVVVSKTKEQLFKLAEEIQLDETIGITGTWDQILFVSNILLPEIPLTKELKKSPEDGLMLIISDTQIGGKLFLEKEFEKLISWLNGEMGNEKQKETASKIKYIFIAGDLVEGVGIYPNQEYDLSILDVRDQYIAFGEMLKRMPSHIPILICPGNHDVGRLSEPQLPLSKEYAWPILSLPNVISLSNPSMVNIYAHPEQGFDGLDVMFYHGGSLIYYSENIMSVRKSGGQKRPDLIMKYWLQRRHLAPTHSSTLYIPDPRKDPLLIDKVPDILITGHIHRSSVSSYKNVTCFNASCWVAKSPEQERRGLEPQPGRAFIVDMRTREVKVMNFLSKEDQEKENEVKSADNPASV